MLNNFELFLFLDQAILMAWTSASIHGPTSNLQSCKASYNHSKLRTKSFHKWYELLVVVKDFQCHA